VSGFRRLYS